MELSKLPDEELFGVLLCGEAPKDGHTIQDYMEEWNKRCDDGMKYEVEVSPVS